MQEGQKQMLLQTTLHHVTQEIVLSVRLLLQPSWAEQYVNKPKHSSVQFNS